MNTARVLVADPPWAFSDSIGRRGAAANYPVLSIGDICNFPLPRLADDAYLFLWRVSSMPWGFTPKTELVWYKKTANDKPHFGMGHHLRASHETCIVATRGKPKPKSRSIRTVFSAPVGRHSAKPDGFYSLVKQFSDGPYVELFARRERPRWTCYGNELSVSTPPLLNATANGVT